MSSFKNENIHLGIKSSEDQFSSLIVIMGMKERALKAALVRAYTNCYVSTVSRTTVIYRVSGWGMMKVV